ncbi:MAG: 8-amino-7-oxononanoate synthase [Leptospirillia bacterium]
MDFSDELKRLEADGRLRTLYPVDGPQAAVITYRGREVLNFASNDYLGLANHPQVVAAVRQALDTDGFGAGAARLISGNHRVFGELEARLAELKGTEAALLFGSGYQANLGLMQALAPEGVVLCDRLNHASLFDGARLAGAGLKIYPHGDAEAAGVLLDRYEAPQLIATDGVFSMDGDLAPLPELSRLARDHGALLMVDDAHGTGVLGGGRGSVHHLGLSAADVPVQMGTLGKALGGYGAFVAGSRELIDFLINRARSFIYTTGAPPALAAGALAALEISSGPEGDALRERLEANRIHMMEGLRAVGVSVPDQPTPILLLLVGDDKAATNLSEALLEAGILAPAVRTPTVPKGSARLRITLMATHETAHLDRAIEAIGRCHAAV